MADQGQHSQSNDEFAFLMLVIAVPIVMGLLWHFAGRYIYVWERIALYGLLSAGGSFPTHWPGLGYLTRKFLFFWHTPPSEIEFFGDAVRDSLVVNVILAMVMLVLVIRRVIYVYQNHPFAVFGRSMNLYDYLFQQMPMYPHLRVMWKLRLLARPLNEGLFRMADSAKSFAIRNDLVRMLTKDGDPVLDERKAKRVFEGQLGLMLPMPSDDPHEDARRCIARLTNEEKAVLATVVPRLAACDPDVSDEEFEAALATSNALVVQYWEGFDSYNPALPLPEHHAANPDMPLVPPPPPVNTAGCDEVLRKYLVYPRVRQSMLSHAYVRGFIYDALQACRKVGKFSPARLRWLRMKDRAFWLVVDAAGRNTPFWETAGMHAHYLWERKAKHPTEKPHVEEAVVALRDELDRMLFTKHQKQLVWAAQGGVPVAVRSPAAAPSLEDGRKRIIGRPVTPRSSGAKAP